MKKTTRTDPDDAEIDDAAMDHAVLIFFHDEATRPSVGRIGDVRL